MSLNQFIEALSVLPQIVEHLKSMDAEGKEWFVNQLGLAGEEKRNAMNLLTCFQEERPLKPEEQAAAMVLLEKALQMNDMDLMDILQINQKTK